MKHKDLPEIDVSGHDEFQEYLEFLTEQKETYRNLYEAETLKFNERLNKVVASKNKRWHQGVAMTFMGDKPALDKLREWGLQFSNDFYKE